MISDQQRANHNTYLINEIEHIMKRLSKSERLRICSLLARCFDTDNDVEYTKALKRTYSTACKAWDNLNMD